jgi:predicted kinase
MIGLPSSGKSFIAKNIAKENNAIIISSDSIREQLFGDLKEQEHNDEVFKIFHSRIKSLLIQKRNVIADATNLTIKDRKSFFNTLFKVDCDIIACVIARRTEECIESNKNRENPVPEYVIYRMQSRFQIPFFNEGFKEIIVYYNNDKDQYDDFEVNLKSMEDFDQKTKWHTMLLKEHCDSIAKNYDDNWLILSAKLHDVGKLFTQSDGDNGDCHYYSHAEVGSYYLLSNYKSLSDFGLDSDEILKLLFVVNYHMFPFSWETLKTHAKWCKIFGEEMYDILVEFNLYDMSAK